jgi:hypothetical protein
MHRLIPDSTLHVYSGGHLELAVDAERVRDVACQSSGLRQRVRPYGRLAGRRLGYEEIDRDLRRR